MDATTIALESPIGRDGIHCDPRLVRPGVEAWECKQPLNADQSARPWLGKTVVSRPDGGAWALESGIVCEHERQPLEGGWFNFVNERNPDGLLTHTQEVYPPDFKGCTLSCCAPNSKDVDASR